MEKINLKFLGTSDSMPTKMRNHSAIFLVYKNENILIDCGEGTQRQFKIAGISPTKITSILITHTHGDHIFGLPGLLQTLAMLNYHKKLKIYGPKGINKYFQLLIKLFKIKLFIEINEVENETFINNREFCIETKTMDHTARCNAYSFIVKDKIRLDKNKLKRFKLPNSPLLKDLQSGKSIVFDNKRIKSSDVTFKEKGKKITVILDTKINNNAANLARNADVLIIESSFAANEKDQAEKFKHLTSNDAASIAKKAGVKHLILTHISQRYENNSQIIEKEAKKTFKNTTLAKDFDSLII